MRHYTPVRRVNVFARYSENQGCVGCGRTIDAANAQPHESVFLYLVGAPFSPYGSLRTSYRPCDEILMPGLTL